MVVHCKGGYRSSIAASILRRAGFREIADLTGGFDAWQAIER
jgi:rhodanese-related sulfurtransferase